VSTLRNQILEAELLALNTGRPSGVPQAERELLDDLPEGTDLAISVGELTEKVFEIGPRAPLAHHRFVTAVDCWARGTTAAPAGKALDPLLEWVVAALCGSQLGGLVDRTVEVEIQWDRERKESRAAHATVFVVAFYLQKVNDATVAA
jgi:hypothetical protein